VDRQVSDSVSDDRDGNVLQFMVRFSRHLLLKILSKGFVASKWSFFVSVNAPDKHTLH